MGEYLPDNYDMGRNHISLPFASPGPDFRCDDGHIPDFMRAEANFWATLDRELYPKFVERPIDPLSTAGTRFHVRGFGGVILVFTADYERDQDEIRSSIVTNGTHIGSYDLSSTYFNKLRTHPATAGEWRWGGFLEHYDDDPKAENGKRLKTSPAHLKPALFLRTPCGLLLEFGSW